MTSTVRLGNEQLFKMKRQGGSITDYFAKAQKKSKLFFYIS